MTVKDVTPHYNVMCTTVARKLIIVASTSVLIGRRGEKNSSY